MMRKIAKASVGGGRGEKEIKAEKEAGVEKEVGRGTATSDVSNSDCSNNGHFSREWSSFAPTLHPHLYK